MIYLQIFWEFFKTGLFAIGGGMATTPFLLDMSARYGWFTSAEFADMLAVSESTPGPIGINMATYVGYTTAGIAGGALATFALVLPSLIIILLISALLSKFAEKPVVKTVFTYLRPAVLGLVAYALWKIVGIALLGTDGLPLPVPLIGFAVIFILMRVFKKIHPIVWVAVGALFGILFL